MKYKIVVTTEANLETEVNALIEGHWRPHGSPTYVYELLGDKYFIQAMVQAPQRFTS